MHCNFGFSFLEGNIQFDLVISKIICSFVTVVIITVVIKYEVL